jgi:hypothetical protein
MIKEKESLTQVQNVILLQTRSRDKLNEKFKKKKFKTQLNFHIIGFCHKQKRFFFEAILSQTKL